MSVKSMASRKDDSSIVHQSFYRKAIIDSINISSSSNKIECISCQALHHLLFFLHDLLCFIVLIFYFNFN